MKPFAVLDTYTKGLSTLASVLAAKKYLVFDYGTSTQDTIDQAPYRWAQNDPSGSAINAGEFMGKQLVKGKAQWAGDDAFKSEKRKFGVVYPKGFDIDSVHQDVRQVRRQARDPAAGVHHQRLVVR